MQDEYSSPFRLTGATEMELDHGYFKVTYPHSGHFLVWHGLVGATFDVNLIHDNVIMVPYGSAGYGTDGMYIDGDGFSIYNNSILSYYLAGADGDHQDGWQGAGGNYIKIYNNLIVNAANYGLYGEAYASGYSHMWIYNNLIMISDSALNGGYPGGIIVGNNLSSHRDFIDVVEANNTIVDIGHVGMSLGDYGNYSTFTGCRVENNIFINSAGLVTAGNTTSTIDHNVWITSANAPANFVAYTAYGGTNNNLHLLAGASSLIGQAVDLSSYFTTDKDGKTRTAPWDLGAYEYTGNGGDTTAPTVSLTAPANGTQLTGSSVTVSAVASDNVGVAGVQFKLDGNNLGAEVTSVPYQISWDTTQTANGSHTLTAVARDAAGNTAISSAVNVTVSNTIQPACLLSTNTWQSYAFVAQSGKFRAEFDATPFANGIDVVIGLSRLAATAYTDLATIVRFNTSGSIDAMNGSWYAAAVTVPYASGTSYHFRLEIDVPNHIYSIYVTPQGAGEITLGSQYAFRSTQATVTNLSYWTSFGGSGDVRICNFNATSTSVLYGDVSGDGNITAYDAALAAQTAVGLITLTPEQVIRADVSGDGKVSAYDAALIAQRAVGLIDKFPVE